LDTTIEEIKRKSQEAHELLEQGDFAKSLEISRELYKLHPTSGFRMNIGAAQLCLRDYEGAFDTFTAELNETPRQSDYHYIRLGVCSWCKDERQLAVETWRQGLSCKYTDAAGGMEIPLLFVFAGIRLGNEPLIREGTLRISEKLEGRYAANWPAPIGRYLLGQASETEVVALIETFSPALQARRVPQFDFYRAVTVLQQGCSSEYWDRIRGLVNAIPLRVSTEWLLARHELDEQRTNKGGVAL
jgi:hypothetical protein